MSPSTTTYCRVTATPLTFNNGPEDIGTGDNAGMEAKTLLVVQGNLVVMPELESSSESVLVNPGHLAIQDGYRAS